MRSISRIAAIQFATGETNGGRAFSRRCDVGDMTSCRDAAEDALTRLGRVDVLVNNAALFATLKSGRFDTIAEEDWESCMRVNVTGVWELLPCVLCRPCANGVAPWSISPRWLQTYGLPNALHYTTSKGGRDWIDARSRARTGPLQHTCVNAVACGR